MANPKDHKTKSADKQSTQMNDHAGSGKSQQDQQQPRDPKGRFEDQGSASKKPSQQR